MKDKIKPQSIIALMVTFIVTFVFIYKVRDILMPFIASIILAYLLNPIVNWFERKSINRTFSTTIILFAALGLIFLLIVLTMPALIEQIGIIIKRLPIYKEAVQMNVIKPIGGLLNKFDPDIAVKAQNYIQDFAGSIISYIFNLVARVFESSSNIMNVTSLVLITPVVSFYILRDYENMVDQLIRLIPVKVRVKVLGKLNLIDKTLFGYLRGQVNVCLIMAVIYAVALMGLRLEFGFLIGMFAGLLTFIPIVGVGLCALIALIVAAFQFASYTKLLSVLMVFVIGTVIEGNFLTPKLVGEKIGLHPVWMIFAMFASGTLFGFTGMLIAIPLAAITGAVIRIIHTEYITSDLYNK